jgi:hypothetical protein
MAPSRFAKGIVTGKLKVAFSLRKAAPRGLLTGNGICETVENLL